MTYLATILNNGPVAYYRMNIASGSVVPNIVSSLYAASLVGSFTLSQPGALLGDSDTAIAFTGLNSGLVLPSSLDITTFSACSIEYWLNVGGDWNHVVIVTDGQSTTYYVNGALTTPDVGGFVLVGSLLDVTRSLQDG